MTSAHRDVVKDPLTRTQRARCAAYVSWVKCSGKARSMMMTSVKQQGQCGNRESLSKQQFLDCDSSCSESNEDLMNDSVCPTAASSKSFSACRSDLHRAGQCITAAKAPPEGFGSEESSTVSVARLKREDFELSEKLVDRGLSEEGTLYRARSAHLAHLCSGQVGAGAGEDPFAKVED